MEDRVVIYRKNGKCVVDTNTEEDENIFFEINNKSVSLKDVITSVKVFMGYYEYIPRPLTTGEMVGRIKQIKQERILVEDMIEERFQALEKKVKALEDQHREISPDAGKYICIDLGYPFKKIYVEKPK